MAVVHSQPPQSVFPKSHVGFDSITNQIEKKLLKRGFQFNVICVGQTGLGKSTLINTIFASHLVDSKGRLQPTEPIRSTTEIHPVTHIIEENGVRLRLNIVDTPGYGDLVNNDRCWDPIVKYIKDQHSAYLRKELTAQRERYIQDTRIHCCLYFIAPTGHALKPIDIVVLKKLSETVNVVPVIAKADSLTLEERQLFKDRIKEEFAFHNIRMYPYESEEYDAEEAAMNSQIKSIIPFAVVGSEKNINVNGKTVRGRQNRWGTINVEDEKHCEFVYLRDFLTRTHLQDLIETTSQIHYESFRAKQLLALKESSAQVHGGSRAISPSADRELSRQSQRMTMNGPPGPPPKSAHGQPNHSRGFASQGWPPGPGQKGDGGMGTPRRSSDGAAALLKNAQGNMGNVPNGDHYDTVPPVDSHRLSKAGSLPITAIH